MDNTYLKAVLLILVPTLLILGGGWFMNFVVDRSSVTAQLQKAQCQSDRDHLYQRLQGYTASDVRNHWALLDKGGLLTEQHFLEIDLLYPFVYGGILFGALLVTWSSLGGPFSLVWLLVPVATTVIADWVENLVQGRQLSLYIAFGPTALENTWIQVASIATTIKIVFFICSTICLICLVSWMVIRASNPRPIS